MTPFYPNSNNRRIEPTTDEKRIQGGNLCYFCGGQSPCGNINDCAWWGS